MSTVITVCFIVIMMITGITELLRRFWLYLIRPKGDTPKIMLIFLKDDIFKEQLQSALEYLSWEGNKNFVSVAAIDCDLTEENKILAQKFADSHSNIIYGKSALDECIADFKTDYN